MLQLVKSSFHLNSIKLFLITLQFIGLCSGLLDSNSFIEDCSRILNTPGRPPLPQVVMKNWDWAEVLTMPGSSVQFSGDATNSQRIRMECTAPYPIAILFNPNENSASSLARTGATWYHHRYTNFSDPFTYTFYTIQELELGGVTNNEFFVCQSVENLCLQRTLQYSYFQSTHLVQFEILKDAVIPTIPTSNKSACQAKFYYENPPTSDLRSAYKFRCQFHNGQPGVIRQVICANRARCHLTFRYRQQEEGCFSQFNPSSCRNCLVTMGLPNFIATITTCLPASGDQQNIENFGSLVFYGVPRGKNSFPKIFFDDVTAEQEPEELIYMEEFVESQKLNNTIQVDCIAAGYYTAASIQYALEFEDEQQLKFLPVSPHVDWTHELSARQQSLTLTLNETYKTLRKIYCFAASENTYEWINTSRPIRIEGTISSTQLSSKLLVDSNSFIEDCSQFLNTPGRPPLPQVVMKNEDWAEVLTTPGSSVQFSGDATNYQLIRMECTAPYPIAILFKPNENEVSSLAKIGNTWYHHHYTNFSDPFTYTFYTIQELKLGGVRNNESFVCQSVENLCLQQTLQYSYFQPAHLVQFEILNDAVIPTIPTKHKSDCQAKFYYENPPPSDLRSPYKFRCQFQDGRPGVVKQIICATRARCHLTFRYRQQEEGCFSQFNPTFCRNCLVTTGLPNFIASITTCTPASGGQQNIENFGSLVFYGVPRGKESFPKIFFDDATAEQEPQELIYMEEFVESQKLNNKIQVDCMASGYYTAASFQYALEFEDRQQLVFLPVTTHVDWTNHLSARQQSLTLILNETYKRLRRIYCFAASENNYEWINASRPIRIEAYSEDSSVTDPVLIVSIVCPLLLVFGIILALLLRRIRRLHQELRDLTEEEVRDFVYGNENFDPNDLLAPINSRPFDQSLEIPRQDIDLETKSVLGSGQYGLVLKGWLLRPEGKELVAVKTVKPNVDVENFKALLSEIKIMSYLGQHKNIVGFLGACTVNIKEREILAAIEFCYKGDLLEFLKKQRNSFQDLFVQPSQRIQSTYENVAGNDYANERKVSTIQLVEFAHGIAEGMNYLTEKNVIHGDLAARNVLLNQELIPKVSDFGLSRQLINCSNYVKKQQVPLPWKWMSVEALRDMEFSIQSDVWSYGVVLWEIFSLGEIPFPGQNWTADFIKQIYAGYRMKSPTFANEQLYGMMIRCWHSQKAQRPSFESIQAELNQIILTLPKS